MGERVWNVRWNNSIGSACVWQQHPHFEIRFILQNVPFKRIHLIIDHRFRCASNDILSYTKNINVFSQANTSGRHDDIPLLLCEIVITKRDWWQIIHSESFRKQQNVSNEKWFHFWVNSTLTKVLLSISILDIKIRAAEPSMLKNEKCLPKQSFNFINIDQQHFHSTERIIRHHQVYVCVWMNLPADLNI